MSILGIFDIGKSALLAGQYALNVTSNNISNINTRGYTKQDVILGIATPLTSGTLSVGRGVSVLGAKRSYDRFIQAQLLGQAQNEGRSSALDQTWAQVEQVFNDAQGLGLSSSLADYFNAWQDVATSPTSMPQRVVLLQKADALAVAAQGMEQSLLDTIKNANGTIVESVRRANELAADIAKLNDQIVQQESGAAGLTANEVRDARELKLSELGNLIEFTSYEQQDGSVNINVGMRSLVAGTRTNTISTLMNTDGDQELYLDGINITSEIGSGQIGGMLAARADIRSSALNGLRTLMGSLTQQVNMLHSAGFGLDASTGNYFFNQLQVTTADNSAGASITATKNPPDPAIIPLDEYTITFDAGGNYNVTNKNTGALVTSGAYVSGNTIALTGIDVVITGAVTPSDSFTVSPIATAVSNFGVAITDPKQIAAASLVTQLPGDNTTALAITQLTDTALTELGGSDFAAYYGQIVGTVGVMKRSAADSLTFDQNLTASLNARRDSVSGVSLDEEAANLVRYQRAYEAGARMIRVADEMFQTILNL